MASNPLTAVLGELGGATVEAAAFAGGLAVGPILKPALQELENEVWQEAVALGVVRPLDAATAAEVAAEDVDKYVDMETEAGFTGYDVTRFANLYGVTLNAPGTGELLNILRRNPNATDVFAHGLRKARLEQIWDPYLSELQTQRIGIGDLAYMLVRDLVANPFGGQGPTDANDATISDIGHVPIDVVKEAADQGWSKDQLEAFYGRSGLAPAPVTAANAYFRNIANYDQFKTMIAKGDLRPAYANVILNTSRQILTADQYLEGSLRGWKTLKEGKAGAALHGMSDADAQLLYEIRRRPLTPHTITEALAKGGVFQPEANEIQDPYDAAVRQQDLGPEWYDLAKAQKYSPPSLFVIRQLLKDGVYTVDHAELRMRQLGIFPEDATLIAQAYAPAGASTADAHVTKAANQLWTATHKAYLNSEASDADVTQMMNLIGVSATAQPQVLALWQAERSLVRKGLTAANYHKAYAKGDTNDATGQPWTRDETIAELMRLGYSQQEAGQYLDIP